MEAIKKVREGYETAKLYWNHPRPGEYVTYKEIAFLSMGWTAMNLSTGWNMAFGVGNEFTGMTLGMNNLELLIMGYVCRFIGYATTPLNAWIVDNLRSRDGKYRVYIKLAGFSMLLTLISLWLPYETVRDSHQPQSQYMMIFMLFVIGQVQGYVQSWFRTGIQNMVHVITPNTQERTKIMSIAGIIYSMGPTINNLYYPIMVDIFSKNGNKYTMKYFRGTYTPVALFAPLALLSFYGTKERLVIPKSRIANMSFSNSLRAVAGNKIFWIKCADGWNDFLEGAKGDIWNWMVYRAHIMKSSTYGIMNTLCYNASFWSMLLSPWFIKKFGKKRIKVWKNVMQVFIIAGIGLTYKIKNPIVVAIFLFIFNWINRFVDCGEVIDKAIESDMRDNQQYLIGERIDGAFGFVQSYAGSIIGSVTGLFIPWVYKKEGFDGNDYSVLDVYTNYDENKPLSQQTKNPNCVLFRMLDVLIVISAFGAAIDVLPWLLYDISETGQKSMIRVIRIRTIVEDRKAKMVEDAEYIEGCEALMKAEDYITREYLRVPSKDTVKAAHALPAATEEQKAAKKEAVKAAKNAIAYAKAHNEEIEIAEFVMHEINRFDTEFGQKQIELAQLIVSGGPVKFCDCYEQAYKLAAALPLTSSNEERKWRKQDIRSARALRKSIKLAKKHYNAYYSSTGAIDPDLVICDPKTYENAYDLPDDTAEQSRIRRKAMRAASKERNIYGRFAQPYLSAKRLLDLEAGYRNLSSITSDYDETVRRLAAHHAAEEAEAKRIAEIRRADAAAKAAAKKNR